MADTYEKDLSQKTSLTTSDYIRVVGSDNVSYKQLVSAVAKTIIETYAGSVLGSATQSVKSAIDSLYSNTAYESWSLSTALSWSDLAGRVIRAGSQITIYAQMGGVSLSAGANNLGRLSKYYPSATMVSFGGFIGTASTMGTPVRVTIDTNGTINCYASSAVSGTLRFTVSYGTSNLS